MPGLWQAMALMGGGGPSVSSTIATRPTTFTITPDHLKLLKASVIKWSSEIDGTLFGSAIIDPRRPYGDKDVYRSMVKILDFKLPFDTKKDFDIETDDLPYQTENRLEELHQETQIALAICLNRQSFETGQFYWPEPPAVDWVKVGDRDKILAALEAQPGADVEES